MRGTLETNEIEEGVVGDNDDTKFVKQKRKLFEKEKRVGAMFNKCERIVEVTNRLHDRYVQFACFVIDKHDSVVEERYFTLFTHWIPICPCSIVGMVS